MRLHLLAVPALAVGCLAAHADTDLVTITSGGETITFDVPSSPSMPVQTGSGGFELGNLTFNVNGTNFSADAAFYPTTTPFPGIEADYGPAFSDFIAVEGIQVFSGTIQAPTFLLQTFQSSDVSGLSGSSATVTITDLTPPSVTTTPEPSTFALLGTGVAAVAAALRRRRA